MRLFLGALAWLALPVVLVALPPDDRIASRHMILAAEHTLLPEERGELARRGCVVVRPLGGGRYIVRVREGAAADFAADFAVAALQEIDEKEKIFPSARREAGQFRPWSGVRILFHDDVSFDAATAVIRSAGGTIDDPLATGFAPLRQVAARIPDDRLGDLASSDAVFQIHGPFGRIDLMNRTAALLSSVAELHAAPYSLSGAGVVVAVMDYGDGPATADSAHPEFEGRVTRNGSERVALHPTHVTGTIAARGINADAKGMAPAVTVQNFSWTEAYLDVKAKEYSRLSVRADNNSIGFVAGWSPTTREHGWEWWGDEAFGAYSDSTAALDAIARSTGVIMAWSAGNDVGDSGPSAINSPFLPHYHQTEIEDDPTVFCVSVNKSGSDCPAIPCQRCELQNHPPDGPFRTMSTTASGKNVLAVGAVYGSIKDEQGRPVIAPFSSRGPARDGRVKPDLVAKGTGQTSTANGGGYARLQGTSMSAPVVTGIAALVIEQWMKTMGGATDAATVRALLIHGADDAGLAGPDYTFGFGIANAKKAVDAILADAGTGTRIRREPASHGVALEYPLTLAAASDLKITLAWDDPENTPFAEKTLINDLDLKLIDPAGGEILPYVLNPANPEAVATRGVNAVDNVEVIEMKNAAAGSYKVRVVGKTIPSGTQPFVLVSSAPIGPAAVPCRDPYEPNDAPESAWGRLKPNATIAPAICAADDVDYFRFTADRSGAVTITVTATGTPMRVTLSASGISPIVATASLGAAASVSTNIAVAPVSFLVKVEPAGALGARGAYTLQSLYPSSTPNRTRGARR